MSEADSWVDLGGLIGEGLDNLLTLESNKHSEESSQNSNSDLFGAQSFSFQKRPLGLRRTATQQNTGLVTEKDPSQVSIRVSPIFAWEK